MLLLCASRAGYLRLCDLLSRAWLRNQYRARAEISRESLEEAGTEGLIALSGAAAGDGGQALAAGNAEAAERLARGWAELFPGRYYIELQRAGFSQGEALVARSVALAGGLALPVVATHPVQFLEREDFKAPEARAVFQAEGRDVRAFRGPAVGARELGADRAGLQPGDAARQEPPAGFPDAA